MIKRTVSYYLVILYLIPCIGIACGGKSTDKDGADQEIQDDTPQDITDAVDVTDLPADVIDVQDVSDALDLADQQDCPMIPPGCIDTCRDEEDHEVMTLGVSARRCEIVTDEHGCPALSFTDEDCGEGTCIWSEGSVECLDPVECDSAACACPHGHACSCGQNDCVVTCEGDCIVTMNGNNGTMECADEGVCRTVCNAPCTTNCTGSSECSQECNVTPADCTCNGCG